MKSLALRCCTRIDINIACSYPNRDYCKNLKIMKLNRITSNPNRMNGQPCIRNLRLTVRRVIELLATYPNREELRQEFPELEEEDIQQALIFASSYLTYAVVLK